LNAFAAEVESHETFILDPAQAPDVLTCAKEVVDALFNLFTEQYKHNIIEGLEGRRRKLRLERLSLT